MALVADDGGCGAIRFLRAMVGVLRRLALGLWPGVEAGLRPAEATLSRDAPTAAVGGRGARFFFRRVYALSVLQTDDSEDTDPYIC